MNLYEKLWKLQCSIRGLGKDARGNNYTYVSGSKLLPLVREKMDELKLILKQEVLEIDNTRQDYLVGRENRPKSEILSKVSMRFTWVDVETGERDENLFAANGQNDWEKGFGSALTYAERYFLLKYFHIPTDEDDIDNPARKPETQQVQQAPAQQAPQPEQRKKLLPKEKYNDVKFLAWIKQHVKLPTKENINALLDSTFTGLIDKNMEEIYQNFKIYEQQQRNTAAQPANPD